ncbi:hypothetical protein GE061_014129 [Apolygus lucorum]|uniref:C2H2-type domain-containing protein n=1 Tax=Apolygus lucorum TaxID=248454 RepID=A0A6A4K2F7_APOLU|nr:hypothetical protein GE061_014129 [Apolygus lucorum]
MGCSPNKKPKLLFFGPFTPSKKETSRRFRVMAATRLNCTEVVVVKEEPPEEPPSPSSYEYVEPCGLEPECIMKEETQDLQVDLDGEIEEVTNAWVQEPFLCVRCGFTSNNLKSLAEHNKQHNGFTPYSCAVCGFQTTRFWHIKNHMVAHTGKAKLYSCPLCEFVSSYLKNVKRHIRLHIGKELPADMESGKIVIPPIKCLPMSKAQLSPEDEPKAARISSHDPKSYKCGQCSYETAYHSNLIRHSRKHTGERPYPCSNCPYRAIQHSDLTRHIRTHTGEKPYECQLCNYKSAQAGDLAVHKKRHAACEIYECYICGFKAIQKSYVTRHINRKHSEDLINHLNSI